MDEPFATSEIADPKPSPIPEPPKPPSTPCTSDSVSMVVNGMVKPSAPPAASVDPVSSPTPKERLHSLIERDMKLLDALGLEGLVKLKCPRGDLALLDNVDHPARHLFKDLNYHGAPVRFATEPWSVDKISPPCRVAP